MANVIVSPNMNLPVPVPGVETGPQYAVDLNNSLNIIDGHNHAPGSGVQVTPQGLDINSDLPIQNNRITEAAGVQFSAPASSALLTYLYTNAQSGGGVTDLFYNDGAGNVIALTKAGEVNATIASIPGESYSGGTFTWKQGAGSTVPANFDIGSVTIRPNTAGTTNGVTVTPPSAISSAYSIALPTVPGSTSFVSLDTGGNLVASIPVAGGIGASNINPSAGLNPAGAVIMYAGTSVPTGYLACDGNTYSTTAFPALFAAIGYTYGGSGTSFILPNTSGIFVRGAGNQHISGKPYSGTQGAVQQDAFEQHSHNGAGGLQFLMSGGGSTSTTSGSGTSTVGSTAVEGVGVETQPANICLMYIIKT